MDPWCSSIQIGNTIIFPCYPFIDYSLPPYILVKHQYIDHELFFVFVNLPNFSLGVLFYYYPRIKIAVAVERPMTKILRGGRYVTVVVISTSIVVWIKNWSKDSNLVWKSILYFLSDLETYKTRDSFWRVASRRRTRKNNILN